MKFMESRKSLRDQIKFLLPPLIELHTSFIYILYIDSYIHPLLDTCIKKHYNSCKIKYNVYNSKLLQVTPV